MRTQPDPRNDVDPALERHHAPVLSKEKARAGETSGHVRLVLGISMSLTVIGLGVLVLLFSANA